MLKVSQFPVPVQEPPEVKGRCMEIVTEGLTTSGLPLVGLVVKDPPRDNEAYFVSVSDESTEMQTIVEWRKETGAGKFQTPYRVVVQGVSRVPVSCTCEWSKKVPAGKPCRHRAGTNKLIQLGKI